MSQAIIASLPRQAQRRERLADQIYGRLIADIAAGLYADDDRLPTEQALALQFGVSRPVVREALTRLQADGFVQSRQGSGTYIRRRPPQRLTQFVAAGGLAEFIRSFEVRIALEPQAARLAAERRSEQDMADIRAAQEVLESAQAREQGTLALDMAVHRLMALASHNPLLSGMLDTLLDGAAQPGPGTGNYLSASRVLDEHNRVIEAIGAGDPNGAEIAMRFHIDQARKRLTDRRRDV